MTNIFETAVRNKFRFTFKGQLSVEDLFDLSPRDLDSIFKTLNAQLKQEKEESLLTFKTKKDEELDLKIQIVKFIVNEKLEEMKAKEDAVAKKEQQKRIMEILKSKEDEELQNKSPEELKAMLNDLK